MKIWFKQKTRPSELWMDWENNFDKNPIQKKTVQIKLKLPHVKRTTSKFLLKHRFLILL